MDNFSTLYNRIEYLRNNGVKMKEMADYVNIAPSVLSSLFTTVLPAYVEALKTNAPDDALDIALSQVNNISKKRLLGSLEEMKNLLNDFEPVRQHTVPDNTFWTQMNNEMLSSVHKAGNYKGLYMSYSFSSSSDCLKAEPYYIAPADTNEYVKVGRISAYGTPQWGFGLINNDQNFYLMFSENQPPQLTMVTVYLQLPLYPNPRMLRGMYLALDYNRNPVARRIVLVKQADDVSMEAFFAMQGGLIARENFTPEQQTYYEYTCQPGDYVKMCTVPSPQLNENDLLREKKMLQI